MSTQNLQFRLASSNDLPDLVDINIDGDETYRSKNEEMFQDIVSKQQVYVVTDEEDKVLGLLYWREEFLGRYNQWYLKQISISQEVRSKGVGKGLLREFLEYAKSKKIEKVFADVHNDNFSSLRLCLGQGGLISGTIEGVGNTEEKDERVIIRFELNH